MVGFGKSITVARREAWSSAYLDYNGLKSIVDDVEQYRTGTDPMWSFTPSSGELVSIRRASLLATNAGNANVSGTFTSLRMWKTAEPDGSVPAATPYKDIAGGPATVNADPWKQGDDAT